MLDHVIPSFRPHLLFRGGHAQTLAGVFLPHARYRYTAKRHLVTLADDDQIVLHDDCPAEWRAGNRAAILIHGLAGCHESGYMERIAAKLAARGVRAFRLDLRGCGAGVGLARTPYHSGRSEDAAAAIEAVSRIALNSPITLVGFSLGANITLKLLGELEDRPCGNLDSAMAVCPPVDLAACSRAISRFSNRVYDRYFVNLLLRQLGASDQMARVRFARKPRTIWEFDDCFTAAVCGFGSAENYYRVASAGPLISKIRLPTLILAARDDPMIPRDALESISLPPAVRLHMSRHGGHLGFIGRGDGDPDRRWMDWRVVDFVSALGHGKFKQCESRASRVSPSMDPSS